MTRKILPLVFFVALVWSLAPKAGATSTLPPFATRDAFRLGTSTAGTLDRSFGHLGFTVVRQGVYAVNDVRVSPNGDIITAVCFNGLGGGIGGFGIDRLLPNGSPDNTFGSGGIAVARFGSGLNIAMSTATQADGKVVAVGISDRLFGSRMMAVARFNQNGSLDASFGTGGTISAPFPGATDAAASVVMVLPNAKILVGGGASFRSGGSGVLMRLNPNGSLDPSFASGGFLNTGLVGRINGLGLEANGKIVALAGTAAVRLLSNGGSDPNRVRGTLVAETHNNASTLTVDERIVVAEGLFDGKGSSDSDTRVFRLFPNGLVDATFQSSLFDFIQTNPDIFQNLPHAVAVQPDGLIVVGGEGHISASVSEFGLARMLGNGAFDPTFGPGCIAVSPLDGNDSVLALNLQPNGDIVAAGQSFASNGGIVVARYLPR